MEYSSNLECIITCGTTGEGEVGVVVGAVEAVEVVGAEALVKVELTVRVKVGSG